MRNVTGQVVRGEDFFDREHEQARFWRDLETDNLLLLAPRRVGKTSLMRRLGEAAPDKGFTAVFVDVSDAGGEAIFVGRLYEAVLETEASNPLWIQMEKSWLGKLVRRVKKLSGAGFSVEFDPGQAGDWSTLGRDLAEALSGLEGRWLLQIDELPVFILKLLNDGDAARERVREFLYWMRRLRLGFPAVRWMLAGSIGLDTVTARLNVADAINDLRIVSLGAFEPDTAHALLSRLSETYGIDLPAPVRERIIQRMGWPVPYYLQLILHGLRDRTESGKTATEDDIEQVISVLLDPAHKGYFDYWRQRLFDELGRPDADHAKRVLDAAARDPDGASRVTLSQVLSKSIADPDGREDKLRYLLDVLENDGYLVEHAGRWRFRFPLLREYWLKRVAS